MIPKLIHYVWLGNKVKPPLVNKCIESWKRNLPKHEIIEWNENNSPLNITYLNLCIEFKQWAFASDYIRIFALYNYGGIYFDTDMELCQPLPKHILGHSYFAGYEDDNYLNCAIIGSEKNHLLNKELLDYYDKNLILRPIPKIFTEIVYDYVHLIDIFIAPVYFFYPLNFNKKWIIQKDLNKHYTIHHWNASWINSFLDFQKNFFLRKTENTLSNPYKELIINLLQNNFINLTDLLNISYDSLNIILNSINLSEFNKAGIRNNYILKKYINPTKYNTRIVLGLFKDRKYVRAFFGRKKLIKIILKSLLFQS